MTKLLHLAPEESHSRLKDLVRAFRYVLGIRPKENAVKTEIERILEGHKAIVKVSIAFQKVFGSSSDDLVAGAYEEDQGLSRWWAYADWLKREFPQLLKAAEDEMKDQDWQ